MSDKRKIVNRRVRDDFGQIVVVEGVAVSTVPKIVLDTYVHTVHFC